MIEPSDSSTDSKHAVALLKRLNIQRELGQFCDCVIQLHVCPGRLFLAHRCVLAASSPVLASLLVSHGALLDLKLTCLSSETIMEYLLDFIYTGNLPPKSQEDLLLSVAVALQVQELIDDLMLRRKTPSATLNSRKRPFPETQHKENPWSPLSPSRSESPLPSCSSCEAVPVIRHVKACGTLSPIQPTSTPKYDINFDVQEKKSTRTRNVENPSCLQHTGDDNFQNMTCSDADIYEPKSKRAKIVLPSDVTYCHSPLIDRIGYEVLEPRSRTVVQTNTATSPKTVYMSARMGQNRHNDEVWDVQDLTLCDASKENSHHGGLHLNSGHEHGGVASYQLEHEENDPNMPSVSASRASLQLCDISAYVPVDSSQCISGESSDEGQHNVTPHLQSMANAQYPAHVPLGHEEYSSPTWSDTGPYVQESVVLGYSTSAGSPAIHDSYPGDDGSSASQRFSSERDNDRSGPQSSCAHHTFHGQMRYHCFSNTEQQATRSSDSDEDSDEEEGFCVSQTDTCVSGSKHSLPDLTPHASTSRTMDLLADPSNQTQGNPPELNMATQPYQCTLCERAFSQRGSLNRHLRSHLGVRPYSCPHCPMTFSRQYRVTEHMRVHQRGCEDFQRAGPA